MDRKFVYYNTVQKQCTIVKDVILGGMILAQVTTEKVRAICAKQIEIIPRVTDINRLADAMKYCYSLQPTIHTDNIRYTAVSQCDVFPTMLLQGNFRNEVEFCG